MVLIKYTAAIIMPCVSKMKCHPKGKDGSGNTRNGGGVYWRISKLISLSIDLSAFR
jgi:hypothetical protein